MIVLYESNDDHNHNHNIAQSRSKLPTTVIIAKIKTNASTTDVHMYDDKMKAHICVKTLTCMFKMQCYTDMTDSVILIMSLHRRTKIIPICGYCVLW